MFENCPAGGEMYPASQETVQNLEAELAKKAWPVLREDPEDYDYPNPYALGGNILRAYIASIQFESSLANAPKNAWDVSQAKNGKVLAWITVGEDDLCDLHIAGDGGVQLPENSSYLFAEYSRATKIDFGDCVSTSNVTDMSRMFYNCKSLKTLDVSGFDTKYVTNTSWMFAYCRALQEIHASEKFVIQGYIQDMFKDCPAGGLTVK